MSEEERRVYGPAGLTITINHVTQVTGDQSPNSRWEVISRMRSSSRNACAGLRAGRRGCVA